MRTAEEIADKLFRGEFVGDNESLTTQVERAIRSRDAEILEELRKHIQKMSNTQPVILQKAVLWEVIEDKLGGKS